MKHNLNLGFQTFYASKGESNSPLIPEIVRTGKKLKESGIATDAIISLRYGRRVLVNAENIDIGKIKREDLLEIVDFNPVKRVLFVMGLKESDIDAPTHWMIHHARNEINAVVQINDNSWAEKLEKKLPTTKEQPRGTFEFAKEVLKALRSSKKIVIKNRGVLFVGSDMKEVEDLVLETHGE